MAEVRVERWDGDQGAWVREPELALTNGFMRVVFDFTDGDEATGDPDVG